MEDERDEPVLFEKKETKKVTKPKTRGRKKGSTNLPKDFAVFVPAWCRKCGKSELAIQGARPRKPLHNVNVRVGEDVFATVEWARTRCKNCGQIQIQRRYTDKVMSGGIEKGDNP